jgi:predicted house-cleaning NTP pyrophosphatase (Maf/HAM1 superfamily)
LGLPFETAAPIDESRPVVDRRTWCAGYLKPKRAIGSHTSTGHGSDQVATVGDEVLGKPGTHERAAAQLRRLSGRSVTFLTGLCLLNTATDEVQVDVVPFRVHFRKLDRALFAP